MSICKQLGIDDPVAWMNATDPKVLDLWIAEMIFEAEDQNLKPAAEALQQVAKKWQTKPT